MSRERFLDVVWGYTAFPTTRTVDNHIASLRAKVEKNPDAPRWIKTVHGVGYTAAYRHQSALTLARGANGFLHQNIDHRALKGRAQIIDEFAI